MMQLSKNLSEKLFHHSFTINYLYYIEKCREFSLNHTEVSFQNSDSNPLESDNSFLMNKYILNGILQRCDARKFFGVDAFRFEFSRYVICVKNKF